VISYCTIYYCRQEIVLELAHVNKNEIRMEKFGKPSEVKLAWNFHFKTAEMEFRRDHTKHFCRKIFDI
jgi:hypothetical protein